VLDAVCAGSSSQCVVRVEANAAHDRALSAEELLAQHQAAGRPYF
jgi:hypothetical protein